MMIDAKTAAEVNALLDEHGNPRWDQLPNDLCCSRCAYNLRMLQQPRCPECGLEFTWREVMEAQLRRHDWLFEHAWRKKPIRSLILTEWAALRPWSFWRKLSIHDRINVGPLIALCLLSIGLAGAVYAARALEFMWRFGFWSIGVIWRTVWPIMIEAALFALFCFVLGLRQTLSRCRVRAAQVVRVFGYASLGLSIVWPFSLLAARWFRPTDPATWLVAMMSIAILIGTPWLAMPLGRRYLCLPRPWLIAAAAVLCAYLTTATVVSARRF